MILELLRTSPRASSREETLTLLESIFRRVEDGHSGVPAEPYSKERLYPPVAEIEVEVAGKPWLRRYRHNRRYTLIADNGALIIRELTYGERDGLQVRIGERTELELPGADGRRIADFDL